MNITDVGHMVDDDAIDAEGEDKMEAARKRLLEDKKSGKLPAGVELDPNDPYAIAAFYANAFLEDARTLGMRVVEDAEERPELMPRPTRVVPQMLRLVATLLDKGHAYIGSDGVAYFDTQTFPDYGRLSGNTLETIRSGAGGRVSDSAQAVKRHPADFMLWKPDPTHLMRWDPKTELGRDVGLGEGFPGWHLECSAMAAGVLGNQIDLHSGGEDNIFPHHECEIAQSRCAFGTDSFARYWFHPRFLMVEGGKMSKSAGTFFTVRDLLAKGFSPAAIRLELIKTHYRANANFTEQGLVDSQRMINRWRNARIEIARRSPGWTKEHNPAIALNLLEQGFASAMNDDLNVSKAIGHVNSLIGSMLSFACDEAAIACDITPDNLQERRQRPTGNARVPIDVFERIDGVLGVLALEGEGAAAGDDDPEAATIDDLIRRRAAARKAKDFAEADRIRDELASMDVEITDGPGGTTWSRKARL